jgi:hypothetical protein
VSEEGEADSGAGASMETPWRGKKELESALLTFEAKAVGYLIYPIQVSGNDALGTVKD